MFQTKFVKEIKTHPWCVQKSPPPRKLWPLWNYVEKFGRARHTTEDSIIRRMRFACRATRQEYGQTHHNLKLSVFRAVRRVTLCGDTHNIWYLLLSHGNNGYANAPQFYVIRTLPGSRDNSVGIAAHSGWTVRGSNPDGGEIFRTDSGRGVALTTHPHLSPRLKKEHSYTSTPPLGLRGLFWCEFYLYVHCLFFSVNYRKGIYLPNEFELMYFSHNRRKICCF